MKRIVVFLFVAWLSPMTCATVWAQASAQINGTVRDQSGAVLPGVEVTATQTETGIIRSTITNETGSYILPNLALGPYRLEAGLQGFRRFVQTGIVLQVNSNPTINVVLEVGQVAEQVEVKANAALVETRSVGVGTVMETRRIVELPLNGRNAQELNIVLPPSWQFDMALARVFRLRETQSLEFRAEAYNVTNSFRPGTINMNWSAGTFGQIRTSLDPRILQFALKYMF
jgi:carboxypeptidase family protein